MSAASEHALSTSSYSQPPLAHRDMLSTVSDPPDVAAALLALHILPDADPTPRRRSAKSARILRCPPTRGPDGIGRVRRPRLPTRRLKKSPATTRGGGGGRREVRRGRLSSRRSRARSISPPPALYRSPTPSPAPSRRSDALGRCVGVGIVGPDVENMPDGGSTPHNRSPTQPDAQPDALACDPTAGGDVEYRGGKAPSACVWVHQSLWGSNAPQERLAAAVGAARRFARRPRVTRTSGWGDASQQPRGAVPGGDPDVARSGVAASGAGGPVGPVLRL